MVIAQPKWALVLGGADCVWDDVLNWEAEYGAQWDGVVIAANDVGAHWPRELHHWASLHPEKLRGWMELRARHHLPMEEWPMRWGSAGRLRTANGLIDRRIEPIWPGGSSGMLAVQVAQTIGCTHVVLCGIPMTPTAHFGETHLRFDKEWAAASGHWRAWKRHKPNMLGWVRSMSGRTQELLGAPTREWLLQAPPIVVPEYLG